MTPREQAEAARSLAADSSITSAQKGQTARQRVRDLRAYYDANAGQWDAATLQYWQEQIDSAEERLGLGEQAHLNATSAASEGDSEMAQGDDCVSYDPVLADQFYDSAKTFFQSAYYYFVTACEHFDAATAIVNGCLP